MPLSPPVTREHRHTRTLDIRGYRRGDGLWDIEGHITDAKPFPYHMRDRGDLAAGDHIHAMWLRLTIDEDLLVHDVEAAIDASPYRMCPAIAPNFRKLVGLRIGPGWNLKTRSLVGGVEGCTHIVEMLAQMATTALQTLWPERERRMREAGERQKPPVLNSCHAWASDSEMIKEHWPEFYSGE